MSREAIEEAIEVLEDASAEMLMETGDKNYYIEAIAVLRQALKTEPFEYWNAVEGWVKIDEMREHFDSVGCGTIYKSDGEGRSPLYTAPTKREWVGLTDEEVSYCRYAATFCDELDTAYMAELIEKDLKEKNHG
jgi:hypothetical protein